MATVKTIKRGELARHGYVPPEGSSGYSLKKASDDDADLEWGPGQHYGLTEAEETAGVSPADFQFPVEPIVDVRRYGAVGDGVTDDTAAIRRAATVINEMGGGTLVFSPGANYLLYSSESLDGNLCSFADLSYISVIGNGATLTVDTSRGFDESEGTLFLFNNCRNITVDGFFTNGPTLDVSQVTVKGYEFVRCLNGCRNIRLPANRVVNMIAGFMATREITEANSTRCQNIDIGILDISNCWYGITGQFSGDNLRCRVLRTATVHRSVFMYGVSNVDISVWSQDHKGDDVVLRAADADTSTGADLENIRISYHSPADSTSCGQANKIALGFWGDTAMSIRNVEIRFHVVYNSSGNTGGPAVFITKLTNADAPDTTDRGHVLENLKISGSAYGSPSYNNGGLIVTDNGCTWGTGDFFRNWMLRDIFIDGTGATSQIYLELASLTDQITLENVSSDQVIQIVQSDSDPRGPHVGKLILNGVECPNRYATSGSAQPLDHYTQVVTPNTVRAGWTGRTITNSGVGGASEWDLPAAVVGLEYTFMRVDAQVFDLDPNGTEVIRGGAAGQMLRMNTAGNMVKLKCFIAGTWEVVYSQGAYTFV